MEQSPTKHPQRSIFRLTDFGLHSHPMHIPIPPIFVTDLLWTPSLSSSLTLRSNDFRWRWSHSDAHHTSPNSPILVFLIELLNFKSEPRRRTLHCPCGESERIPMFETHSFALDSLPHSLSFLDLKFRFIADLIGTFRSLRRWLGGVQTGR